ncbi:MAG: hypothetical protein HOD92_26980 [Deltaproteobacteria bacterium]|jgi:hypothetical protein|nr:hypothetical protein [Deltaproteobacteria bacterium]
MTKTADFVFFNTIADMLEIYINLRLFRKYGSSFHFDPNDLKSEDVEEIAIDAAERVFQLVEDIIVYCSDEIPDLAPEAREIAFEAVKRHQWG